MPKLIFGCGYVGQRVARLWREVGEDVCAVTRSAGRAAELQAAGLQTLVADVTRPETLAVLPQAETVLFAVGFDRSVGNSIHDVYADGVQNVLAALPSSVQRFIYISTTGVYGPADGDWVDEDTPANPQREGGKASLAAEQLLTDPPPLQGGARGGSEPGSDSTHQQANAPGEDDQTRFNAIVLRFAGIYGPDRIPYLAKLRAGEPIAAPSEGWLNLIHVDDGAAIVLAAEQWLPTSPLQRLGPEVFCVSDGNPVIRGEYYREVARRIGAEPPKFVAADPNSPAAARAASDKRISNDKLCRELNIDFAYPSYREGLAATLTLDSPDA